jgi:methionyl-tRNA formyltransferase
MEYAIANLAQVIPTQQGEATPTYYRKRCPDDSRIDPSRTIAEQFNLLRVADPERYPAFFDWCGHRYQITLTKLKKL